MARYQEAPEVKDIAERLIPLYHEHLILRMDEIRYLFKDQAGKAKGCQTMATARRITGLNCYLAHHAPGDISAFEDDTPDDMFLIEVAFDVWRDLTPAAKDALVDHELLHLGMEFDEINGTVERWLRPHDVEEFSEILRRHGLWKRDLEDFVAQLQFFEPQERPVRRDLRRLK